jgi:ABC-type lipoprotein release transport system permease subunit
VLPAGGGVLLGCLLSALTSRALGSHLYEVGPLDPATYVGVALSFLVVALFATLRPALRASRIAPVEALRAD